MVAFPLVLSFQDALFQYHCFGYLPDLQLLGFAYRTDKACRIVKQVSSKVFDLHNNRADGNQKRPHKSLIR